MPGMTMTERSWRALGENERWPPAENIWVDVDVLMTHDVCGPGTIGIFHGEVRAERQGCGIRIKWSSSPTTTSSPPTRNAIATCRSFATSSASRG